MRARKRVWGLEDARMCSMTRVGGSKMGGSSGKWRLSREKRPKTGSVAWN